MSSYKTKQKRRNVAQCERAFFDKKFTEHTECIQAAIQWLKYEWNGKNKLIE